MSAATPVASPAGAGVDAGRPGALPIACVFAKPPRPGTVKTRLAAALGGAQAAALAAAFLEDTCAALSTQPLRLVLATTEPWPSQHLAAEAWLQGDGSLGDRLERVLRRALDSAPWAVALGADSPGFPLAALAEAERELRLADAVFGAARDGGFYLLALRRCPEGCLAGVRWSSAQTLETAERRLSEAGLRCARVLPWFDVDTVADLRELAQRIGRGEIVAPATARALACGAGAWRTDGAP